MKIIFDMETKMCSTFGTELVLRMSILAKTISVHQIAMRIFTDAVKILEKYRTNLK